MHTQVFALNVGLHWCGKKLSLLVNYIVDALILMATVDIKSVAIKEHSKSLRETIEKRILL